MHKIFRPVSTKYPQLAGILICATEKCNLELIHQLFVKNGLMKTKLICSISLFLILSNKTMSQEANISISELIVNSTIRLECTGDTLINGKNVGYTSTGTGFYFAFKIDSLIVPVIVTNNHVVANSHTCTLNFTESIDNSPKYRSIIPYTLQNSSNMWIKHPNVDLAILPINPIIEEIKKTKNKTPFVTPYTEDLIPSKTLLDEITAIEEVLMIGYPKGLWDKTNNLPIVRKGITATPVYLDYEGKKEFLLDIPNYGGSSGSPIVLFNQGSYSSKRGGINIGGRIALLGINVQSYDYQAEGKLLLPANNPPIQTMTQVPFNIAIVIKSEELLGFKPILKMIIDSQNTK